MLEADSNLSRAKDVEGYKVLPPCVLYGKIGQGGMGAVYRGRHLNLDIDVAVKCLKPDLTGEDEQFVVRFRREARSAARINHQNVVRVFDVSEEQGLHYIVMELVQGETARQRVQRKGQLSVGEALEIVYGAASGLGEAHGKGFIHRDIKPDNIMIASNGAVKVADLGLAKPTGASNMSMLSGTNLIMGTPQYMPPEQWENTATVTAAADIWALGATLYYMLVGGEAIGKESLPAIMQRIVLQDFPDVREQRPDVPDDVAEFIKRATKKEPADRFADAREMARAIEDLSTRRQTLEDNGAISEDDQNTLLSPPPAKTLAKIKFWLDEHAQGAGSRVAEEGATMVSKPARAKAAARGGASRAAEPAAEPARGKAGLWAAVVVLLLAVVALGIWQPWQSGERSPFAEADALQRAGEFDRALVVTNQVFAADPSLTGKATRLAGLHLAWANQLLGRNELRGSLEKVDTSIGFEPSNQAEILKRSVLAKAANAVDADLQRAWPTSEPLARGKAVTFRGRFASALGRALLVNREVMELQSDGSFFGERNLDGLTSVPVQVELVNGDTISLDPWVVVYEAAASTPSAAAKSAQPKTSDPVAVVPQPAQIQPLVAPPATVSFENEPATIELRGDEPAELVIRAPKEATIRIDGATVKRTGADEVYVHQVQSTLDNPAAIEVTVGKDGAASTRSIPVVRVPVAMQFVRQPAFSDLRHSRDGKWATDRPSVQISGELNAVANRILINGAPAEDVSWFGNTFTVNVAINSGLNRIELIAERRFYEPVSQELQAERIANPRLTVAEQTRTAAQVTSNSYAVVLDADEWTSSVEVTCGKIKQLLARDPNSRRFRGVIPLAAGVNTMFAKGKNVLGNEGQIGLTITRKGGAAVIPAINAVRVGIGGKQVEVLRDQQVYLAEDGLLVVDGNDPNARVLINEEYVARPISLKGRLSDAKVTPLRIALENDQGRSPEFRILVWLDSTKPTATWLQPQSKILPRGKPFELRGEWADNIGLKDGDSKLDELDVRISPRGPAKKGRWLVKHPGLNESTTLFLDVVDLTGNTQRLALNITVQ